MNQIILIQTQVEQGLRTLIARDGQVMIFRLGLRRQPEGMDLLGHTLQMAHRVSLGMAPGQEDRAVIALSADPALFLQEWEASGRLHAGGHWLALLVVGIARARGRLDGYLFAPDGERRPLHRLVLVGPGMHRLVVASGPVEGPSRPPATLHPVAQGERWSRTQGALGEGSWRRLVALRYGVVGCGRNGSLLVQSLASGGVQHLSLVDPDRLEEHNLGEMVGVGEADLGRPKARALAHNLSLSYPWTDPVPIVASVTARRTLTALLGCDGLFCCADNDGARLATGVLASLYLKPLLDIGTGVLHPDPYGRPQMGADVRLILPGDGCLLCWGGVANTAEAHQALTSTQTERGFQSRRDWRMERAGSLRSLNQIAVGLAMRLWEELVAERQRQSLWLRLAFDGEGAPHLQTLPRQGRPDCPLCQWVGVGDARLPGAIQELLPRVEP